MPDWTGSSIRFASLLVNYGLLFWAGTYLAPNGYGVIGIEWFFIGFLVALLLAGVLLIITQNQRPTDVHTRPGEIPE